MKPFNLEHALAGDPVVTRGGRRVLWIAHCPLADKDGRVVALLEDWNLTGHFCEDGSYFNGQKSDSDLFMAPTKRTVYARLLRDPSGRLMFGRIAYETLETAGFATSVPGLELVGTYPIEIEE